MTDKEKIKQALVLLEKANEGTTLLEDRAYYRITPDLYNQAIALLNECPTCEKCKKEIPLSYLCWKSAVRAEDKKLGCGKIKRMDMLEKVSYQTYLDICCKCKPDCSPKDDLGTAEEEYMPEGQEPTKPLVCPKCTKQFPVFMAMEYQQHVDNCKNPPPDEPESQKPCGNPDCENGIITKWDGPKSARTWPCSICSKTQTPDHIPEAKVETSEFVGIDNQDLLEVYRTLFNGIPFIPFSVAQELCDRLEVAEKKLETVKAENKTMRNARQRQNYSNNKRRKNAVEITKRIKSLRMEVEIVRGRRAEAQRACQRKAEEIKQLKAEIEKLKGE